jgi:hypothetical protein
MLTSEDYEKAATKVQYVQGSLVSNNKPRIGSHGYYVLAVEGKSFLVHRLIWFIVHKTLPKIVDHVDGNRLNNKLENLQGCDQSVNIGKAKMFRTNSTGYKGVHYNTNAKKYEAYFMRNYKKHYLGLFECPELAALVVEEAKDQLERLSNLGA